jgi:hypothetical protein
MAMATTTTMRPLQLQCRGALTKSTREDTQALLDFLNEIDPPNANANANANANGNSISISTRSNSTVSGKKDKDKDKDKKDKEAAHQRSRSRGVGALERARARLGLFKSKKDVVVFVGVVGEGTGRHSGYVRSFAAFRSFAFALARFWTRAYLLL